MKLTLSIPGLALRLIQSHLMMLVIGFLVFATNDFIETNRVITVLATLFLLFIAFVLCYNEAYRCARNDQNQGRDGGPWKGLLAGLLAAVPGAALYAAGYFFAPAAAWYRLYMVVYEGLLSLIGETDVTQLAVLLLLPLVSWLAYFSGRKNKNWIGLLQSDLTKLMYEKKK